MGQLIQSNVNGVPIRRNEDNWFNLGDLAEAGGNRRGYATEWVDGIGSEYIELAKSKLGFTKLLIRRKGNVPDRGIWAHYKIARRFAQAVSAEVAWHVDEIVEGKISVGPPAEQSEAALIRSLNAIADRVEALPRIESDLGDVKNTLDDHGCRLGRLEQAAKSIQKPFSKRTVDAAMACIDDKYNRGGKLVCPCCEAPTDVFEMHHWNGKGGCESKYCFPLRPECHEEAERDPEWHDKRESEYRVFRKHATQYYKASGLIPTTQKRSTRQRQPTLFGNLE